MIKNLLGKNLKKRQGWSKQAQVESYRLYDWEIPQYPFYIDVYAGQLVVYDRTSARDQDRKERMISEIKEALIDIFEISSDDIIWKMRERQKGSEQYEKMNSTNERKTVREGPRQYYVNLHDYLDTGLFLDHRPLRNQFQKENQGEFLNLFSYTCSVGLAAALGRARTTNIDMSNTYLNWGKDNYQLNQIDTDSHQFIQADCLQWLENSRHRYDVIFLDPPSFSNSKRMAANSFDVLRDQNMLVDLCLNLLNHGGKLYFSNNHSKFKLSPELQKRKPKDLTKKTIPLDFHNKKTHHCFLFSKGTTHE